MVTTKDAWTSTDDLIEFFETEMQTELSFACNHRYDNFIVDNRELRKIYKKVEFSNKLVGIVGNKEDMNFIRNEKMGDLLGGNSKLSLKAPNKRRGRIASNASQTSFHSISSGVSEENDIKDKITEILENYAYEAKLRSEIKTDRDLVLKRLELMERACFKFKKILLVLDNKFSR